jgi:hypothetical protein
MGQSICGRKSMVGCLACAVVVPNDWRRGFIVCFSISRYHTLCRLHTIPPAGRHCVTLEHSQLPWEHYTSVWPLQYWCSSVRHTSTSLFIANLPIYTWVEWSSGSVPPCCDHGSNLQPCPQLTTTDSQPFQSGMICSPSARWNKGRVAKGSTFVIFGSVILKLGSHFAFTICHWPGLCLCNSCLLDFKLHLSSLSLFFEVKIVPTEVGHHIAFLLYFCGGRPGLSELLV